MRHLYHFINYMVHVAYFVLQMMPMSPYAYIYIYIYTHTLQNIHYNIVLL
jgi:hypothetical protein